MSMKDPEGTGFGVPAKAAPIYAGHVLACGFCKRE
jgi:hypothetical protein